MLTSRIQRAINVVVSLTERGKTDRQNLVKEKPHREPLFVLEFWEILAILRSLPVFLYLKRGPL